MGKPEIYLQMPSSKNPGIVSFTLSCNEIEEKKTVHIDMHGRFPFGHIDKTGIAKLRAWLDEAAKWMEK